MSIAFVLGNGISRKDIILDRLRPYGKIYACNAIYREFTPDVLISTDKPISIRIQETGYAAKHKFHTRKPVPGLGALPVPKKYYGYSSGPIALAIAAADGVNQIYLIGFDLGPTMNNKFNNLYAGTEFYKTHESNPTFTGNWIQQLCTVMREYPGIKFIRVQGQSTTKIKELEKIGNLHHVDLTWFQDCINNQKGF